MSFIWMIIVGLVAGLLARAIKPGSDPMGWIMTIVLGIVGAMLGGFLASLIGINADGGFTGLIFSVIGAIILLFLYEMIVNKRRAEFDALFVILWRAISKPEALNKKFNAKNQKAPRYELTPETWTV